MPPLAARNPEMQTLRRLLRRRSARSDAGRYVIEGPRLVLDAIDAGVAIDAVYVPTDAVGDDVAALRARCHAVGLTPTAIAPGALEQVASTQAPQPALALAAITTPDLPSVLASAVDPLVLVLCDVTDPGNVGTLLRVAEAAGATTVVVCGTAAVDVHNPKVVRAAAGSLFRLPVVTMDDPVAVLATLHERSVVCLATAMDAPHDYETVDLRGPVAIVLGSEAHGLPAVVLAAVDAVVAIPMLGAVESLNVGVAGAVLAFEAARQRRGHAEAQP
jgi:TrmH family RNA methyltransferase